MTFADDPNLNVRQNIEYGLIEQYRENPKLTDAMYIFALEQAKIAVKQQHGFVQNEKVSDAPDAQGIIAWCVQISEERIGKINDLNLKKYLASIEKIHAPVERHACGSRSYFEFISRYM